jgi:hypothetical protein
MINQDILDTIKKNLPAIAGEMILEELKELNRLKGVEEQLNKEKLISRELLKAQEQYKSLHEERRELDLKGKKLERDQDLLDNTVLKIRLEEATKRSDSVLELVKLIFRSPIVTREVTGSLPGGVVNCNGSSYATTSPVSLLESTQIK